jgi:hypothetical protein
VRLAASVAVLALAAPAAAAAASAPHQPRGKAIAVYAPLRPTVQLFGAPVAGEIVVLVDRRRIDPASVSVRARFSPYEPAAPPRADRRDVGGATRLRYAFTLRCLAVDCVPRGQAKSFKLPEARVVYALRTAPGRKRSVLVKWPALEVLSRVNPQAFANADESPYASHLVPLPQPSYATAPAALFGAVFGIGGLLLGAGALCFGRWLVARRPAVAAEAAAPLSPVDAALALVAAAQHSGDETALRKALERLADELGTDGRPDLAVAAHELAWSPAPPAADAVDSLRVRIGEPRP